MENKLQNSIMCNYVKTDDILKDMCGIIESSQKSAYQAVNTLLAQRNWLLTLYNLNYGSSYATQANENVIENVIEISEEKVKKLMPEYSKKKLAKACEILKMISENPNISIDELRITSNRKELEFMLLTNCGTGFMRAGNNGAGCG